MEIVFVYIKKFKSLKNKEFNLSNEYSFRYDEINNFLQIDKKKDNRFNRSFFGNSIVNLNLLLGKNGSGKSTLLEFITSNINNDEGFVIFKSKNNTFYVSSRHSKINSNHTISNPSNKSKNIIYFTHTLNFYKNFSKNNYVNDISTYTELNNKKYNIPNFLTSEIINNIVFLKKFPDFFNILDFPKIEYLYITFNAFSILPKHDSIENFIIQFIKSNFNINSELIKYIEELQDIDKIMKILNLLNRIFLEFIPRPTDITKLNLMLPDHLKIDSIFGREKYRSYYKNRLSRAHFKLIQYYVDFLLNHKNLINKTNEELYYLKVPLNDTETTDKLNFLLNSALTNEVSLENVEYTWPGLSSGEHYFLTLFSRIYTTSKKLKNYKIVTLILDEPDIHLHPEWSRKFIYFMRRFIENSFNNSVHIILSSHSPYIASDIPKENVIYFSDSKTYGENTFNTFGANIFELFKHSFFLNDGMGEFAKLKIQNEVSEKLNHSDFLSDSEIESLSYVIDNIGDKLINNILSDKLSIKISNSRDIENSFHSWSAEEKNTVKKLLEEDDKK